MGSYRSSWNSLQQRELEIRIGTDDGRQAMFVVNSPFSLDYKNKQKNIIKSI